MLVPLEWQWYVYYLYLTPGKLLINGRCTAKQAKQDTSLFTGLVAKDTKQQILGRRAAKY